MPRKLRIAYFVHSLRSDWNNGNAHFLRGLLRSLGAMGHGVTVFEPETEWSLDNLGTEPLGEQSLRQFGEVYPDLRITTYEPGGDNFGALLADADFVIFHEWNEPALARMHCLGCGIDLGSSCCFTTRITARHRRPTASPALVWIALTACLRLVSRCGGFTWSASA